MFIVPITKMEGPVSLKEMQSTGAGTGASPRTGFQSILKDAIRDADQQVQKTREMDMKLAAGEVDNLHTALIQAEQSAAAIEFTTQLASKAVSAYNQIMGMQI